MQAIVVEKIGEFAVKEMEAKQPGQNEALIKVSVTGLYTDRSDTDSSPI